MALLDAYELKARLSPGLLALLPIAFAGSTLGLRQYPAVAIGGSLLTVAGGAYLLSVLVAHFGRTAQDRLWQRWGGRPTTQLLRYRDCATNQTQRDIWRAALETVTGVPLLSEASEAANAHAAAEVIEAATDQVRYLAQQPGYQTLASENAQYGFERNLFGLRWIGRLVSIVCVVVLIVAVITRPIAVSNAALTVGLVIDTALAIGWMVLPSEQRARAAGFRYADQLLQAVVRAAGQPPARPAGSGAGDP